MSVPSFSPAAAQAVQVLGDHWRLSLLLCLYNGPRRFNQLREDLPRITPRSLSTKLKDLQEAGYVTKHCPDNNRNFCEYALSPRARQLKPALKAILYI